MRRLFFLILIISLVGCTILPTSEVTPSPEATATPTVAPPTPEASVEPPSEGPMTLKIWIPPEFEAGLTLAGDLLESRLEEFTTRRPNVMIETRVKAVSGPGGMIDTITTASAAAPLALPDLVALPRFALETAAIKGLLHPFDGLTTTLEDPDWYDFARQLSHIQNSTFGIPFAGDALIMMYRPAVIGVPPASWADSLGITETLSFPAADPEALFTLALYQSIGGLTLTEEDRPSLDTIQLTEVFTYYQQAAQTGLMPFWLTQYETDNQAWEAYQGDQANMLITWASRYLQYPPPDSAAAPIPTFDGEAFTLGDGWVWALVSPTTERQELSAQLADFLTTSDFLGQWSFTAGYIPTRPSALASWANIPLQTFTGQIALSAQVLPLQDVLTSIGPALQASTAAVLKAELDPSTAAENAAARLVEP
jgi:multiple sugar transport system substrate-binding protein